MKRPFKLSEATKSKPICTRCHTSKPEFLFGLPTGIVRFEVSLLKFNPLYPNASIINLPSIDSSTASTFADKLKKMLIARKMHILFFIPLPQVLKLCFYYKRYIL